MIRSHSITKRLYGQRGTVVILFALLLPVLLGFAALAIDLARLSLTRVELQNAADAAALAGAHSLGDVLSPHWTSAADTALVWAQHNVAYGSKIKDATIETVYWPSMRPSTSAPVAGDAPAIRAMITIDSTHNCGPCKFFFAPFLGIAIKDVQASAIAVLLKPTGGGGASIPKLVQ
ncbi:TadG family pilus assembly protein [Pelodictyon phaeoclathratiforme]|jgi:uncharacterized membrane protein|uniref:Uncharacterized protein n=1 Tax=Pelodictyon phaeoclathratiforme (strain DSM 5477 / BU-1) TaxID=324925 RepID=B4SEK0_PELPB|nr:TadG family pilus assembly protein [Pelodictyon phaeoclathratiforme]ACF43092.1 conserved hypothetical protein [Pelodictyon phaeoclathratiforme BU-1]MBV5289894.1 hypothetical protein [Pelodictyon phaeoclathratiforme]